jgi:hypothetical protein
MVPQNDDREIPDANRVFPELNKVAMKILLQHIRTGLFLRSLGNWTASVSEAHDFQHSQRAIDFAREHKLPSVQIAVKFVESEFDEIFPIPTEVLAAAARARA